ncbi:MAG: FliA/WhiG family RNA polymerase sigma factor [Epulopiscium sp.]|nr:FliA/WhiG family RNA polymerase sigma factor [Candidatus Epulonipiscium sp.]
MGKEVENMWKEYSLTKSPEIKDKLIIHYAPLVKYIAGRLNMYLGENVEYDDLISYGVFGLIDAIDKFDPDREVKFETYASLRIRGSIIDHIRKMDWVPRSLRKQEKDLREAYTELENTLGRPATDEEMINHLGISPEEFHKISKDANIASLTSLEYHMEQGRNAEISDTNPNQLGSPEAHMEELETERMLAAAIGQLTDRERKIITLYYYEELTLKEISAIMGVSESRISQIHTKAISRLKEKMDI